MAFFIFSIISSITLPWYITANGYMAAFEDYNSNTGYANSIFQSFNDIVFFLQLFRETGYFGLCVTMILIGFMEFFLSLYLTVISCQIFCCLPTAVQKNEVIYCAGA